MNIFSIFKVENPEKATVARLENYNSGRLFLIVFRDSEFSYFGPICRSIKNYKVDFSKILTIHFIEKLINYDEIA